MHTLTKLVSFGALALAVLTGGTALAEAKQGYHLTLPGQAPAPATGVVQTDLPRPELMELDAAAKAAAQAAAAAVNAPVSAPLPAGLPQVPASQAGSLPLESLTGPTSEVVGMVPGQPVPVYPTLEAAAQAGVDPFKDERPLELAAPAALEPLSEAFDWRNPSAYLDWLATHPMQGGGILVGVALAVVLLMGAVMRMSALRRLRRA